MHIPGRGGRQGKRRVRRVQVRLAGRADSRSQPAAGIAPLAGGGRQLGLGEGSPP